MKKSLFFFGVVAFLLTSLFAPAISAQAQEPEGKPTVVYNKEDNCIQYGNKTYPLALLSGGLFQMGYNPARDYACYDPVFELPLHWVELADFSIGKTEVPQWLWEAVMGSNPSRWKGEYLPVESVSWNDCREFINRLNAICGVEFSLPTEAQWEYAARSGKGNRGVFFCSNSDDVEIEYGMSNLAWHRGNSDFHTHPVAGKLANPYGLHDMCGNVAEWCEDWYADYTPEKVDNPRGAQAGSHRIVRGGSFNTGSDKHEILTVLKLRATARRKSIPEYTGSDVGLRLALKPVADGSDTADKDKKKKKKKSKKNKENNAAAVQMPEYEFEKYPYYEDLHYDPATKEIGWHYYRYKMVDVEGGTFNMGATGEQGESYSYGLPVHKVTLSDFSIGQTEVPQWLWTEVMGGNNPSEQELDLYPVDHISWNDCQEFIKRLNAILNTNFKLPTEAQWEYAARGGNKSKGYKYSGSDLISAVATYEGNNYNRYADVGMHGSNELGLYDMTGNVSEFCDDWYADYQPGDVTDPQGPAEGENKVVRGGSYYSSPLISRVSVRSAYLPDVQYYDLGLRLAMGGNLPDGNKATPVAKKSTAAKGEKSKAGKSQSKKNELENILKLVYNPATGELRSDNGKGYYVYKMVKVDGGRFSMGATEEQESTESNELPVHRVTLSDFEIGATEVPQWLWTSLMDYNPSGLDMNYNPSGANGEDAPVFNVTWDNCMDFIKKLNEITGENFKLPTEAQWEFAARGGNQSKGYRYSGSNDVNEVAWTCDNSYRKVHLVGQKKPNELGLYDMTGNVKEWCQDKFYYYKEHSVTDPVYDDYFYDGHVLRGGEMWETKANDFHISHRTKGSQFNRQEGAGFRLAR